MLDIHGYRVLGTLRATGSNVLFQAVREEDGLPVIIKTPKALSPSPREHERYRREFAILKRLQDIQGVVRPYACERIHERPVLLLEEVRGKALSEIVGQPLDVPRFLDLAISLASTLAEIHSRDVIHKDIKPSNIIVEPSGGARLVDFGIATLQKIEHLDAAPAHLLEGTLAYMSPEQTGRMNRAVDYRTDFYSLGVTLYELLTGLRPFHGRDLLEWFHAHMAQNPRPPHEINVHVPPVLSAIVLKLLAKIAEERYQSAEGLRADLKRCREGLGQNRLQAFTLGSQDTPHRFQLPQRLYGREAELSTLLRGFERVLESGRPELFLVSGYSGIGKSSVVHELHKPVVQRRGFFLSGKFDQFRRDIPYAPLAQAIRGLAQQLLVRSDEELARWRQRLNEVWEGQGQALVDLVPQLEVLVGRQPPLPQLSPGEAQHRFHRVLRQFLGVFATPEHPLVVFLDDLQWADLASLQLLQQHLSQPEMPPVMWIGAYRDNEVSPAHPLVPVLEEIRKAGARMTHLRLAPLSPEQVERLVGDTLPGARAELVTPLSALAYEKTGGNPFFLLQFLVALSQDGLLTRTPEGGWRWEPEGARTRGYSDNVVDFMAGKLRQLPRETQHLLWLAACVGNVFSLQLLGTLSEHGELEEVEQGLEPALQEGLLVGAGPDQYRFLHDRIRQAAHVLISEAERKPVHLRIGRLLLKSLSPEEVQETIFDVVSQLNAGVDLIRDPVERHQVARLNADAGRRAEAAVAHRHALAWFTQAFALIPGDPWETDPELAFKVRLARARCAHLTGSLAEARELAEEVRSRARTRADIAAAYRLEADICLSAGEVQKSVTCILDCLKLLGMPLSPHPTWEAAVAAHHEAWTLLGDRPIDSLIGLPRMTDPDTKEMMGALASLFPKAFVTDNHLLIINVSRMVSLTLRHGFTDAAVLGFGWFGVLTGMFFKRYREGYAFCILARSFVERYNVSAYSASALLSLRGFSYWTQPLSAVQELILKGYQQGLQSGDFYVASHCASMSVANRISMGHALEEVYEESLARGEFINKAGVVDPKDRLLMFRAFVQQMRGCSRAFNTLSSDSFDEPAFEAGMTPKRMSTTRAWYWVIKLQSRFLCGSFEEALEAGERAAELTWAMLGAPNLIEFHFYRALTLAACFERAAPEKQRRFLEDLRRHQQQLAEWADQCPANFRARERMVFGEWARLEGRSEDATRAYEEAVEAARESGAPHLEGMANELAANFWHTRKAPRVARSFARDAWEAYLQWGAQGKVQHLEAQWPHLAAIPVVTEADTSSSRSTRIDALTVVKAQQAISSEIMLERLVTTLLHVAIENAGAQRGALLLAAGETLSVAASSAGSPGGAMAPSGAGAAPALPWTLLTYVRRTREPVLIDDASQPHMFSSDEYLSRSGVRSVLCLPLLRQEQLSGALYLENNLATSAFSPARLALLEHIASQAAISIENARLYADVRRARTELRQANEELEQRVEERTRELKQAQARLVDTAREVGMAEVAANVLHNVGNVLTSAVINLETMYQAVGSSRVSRVKHAAHLLLEYREKLAELLAGDSRIKLLPDYLAALGEQLIGEQTRLLEDLDAMGRHIEHIRAIVQVQQTYAKASLMMEECALAELIDDALRIEMVGLQRHGVSVRRELSPMPPIMVDKHKVLQILINLLRNAKHALDAKPEGQRHLEVRLKVEAGLARIQVVDDGKGFGPEVGSQLFTHGFTTRKDGHGFGLHSCALAAQLLGGRLTLESEGPGKGAVATLELPLTWSGRVSGE
jgi:predicted ATPase/signal transduction histidine kinase/tRNA A-37 threonylcarbamoyl transferase component Bud32